MRAKIVLIITFLMIISCKRDQTKISSGFTKISDRVEMKVTDKALDLKSGNYTYHFIPSQMPFKKIILLNSSLIGYFLELNAEDVIIGVSSPEYIYSDKIHKLLKDGKLQNVGSDQKYDVEKIISLRPDAVFTNYIASFQNTYELLRSNGIEIIFLDEYLEQKPLEKTAYIKIFGKLLGKDLESEAKFNEIQKNYNALKKLAFTSENKPKVLTNEMYGDIWYLPGGKTSLANFIADANAQYILKNNTDEGTVNMSFEEVFATSVDAEYWVNAGDHESKKEILKVNPFYKDLSVFNKGKIFGIAGREKNKANDYFQSGVVRSDLVLKDYIKIFHPELLPDYRLTYMKELK